MTAISLVGYHLTYDDEFTDPSLFITTTNGTAGFSNSYTFGRTLASNYEAEYYVDPNAGPSPFSVQNGELTITAQPALPGQYTAGLPYSSGMISTEGSFSQNTGYFEIRAETTGVHGFWPAFWMLPVGGAGNPELDVMEQPNLEGNNSYWSYANPSDQFKGGGFNDTGEDLSAGYHSYGLLWTTTSVSFYLDGLQVGPTVAMPPNFTQQMYLIANLAVGGAGSWPGQPTGIVTAQYKIDYIRAYSLDPAVPAVALQPISSPDGVDTTPSYTAPLPIVPATLGAGPDVLVLTIAEDYWQGDAQFTIAVDGIQQGGVQTATASNAAGASQAFRVLGTFGITQHSVTVNFLNEVNGGIPSLARNLYVLGATVNGTVLPIGTIAETIDGPQSFVFTAPPKAFPAVNVNPVGAFDTLTLVMGETPGTADASFTISVDGVQRGGVQSTTALAGSLQSQSFVVSGDFGIGAHVLGIQFLNPPGVVPAPGTALALSLDTVLLNGTAIPGIPQTWTTSTPLQVNFTETSLPVTAIGSGPDVLTLSVSEDAYIGNAQFTITVDGVQQGGIQTARASHALAQSQSFAVSGTFAVGPHSVVVNFLNDAYGGSAQTDRNFYVLGAALNSVAIAGSVLSEYSGGGQSFTFTGTTVVPPTPPVIPIVVAPGVLSIGTGPDVLALSIAEDAWQGDAQFTISIDGIQQGGVQTATASNAAGLSTIWQVLGTYSSGPHAVTVNFLNDGYGGSAQTDRNLYVVGAQINGVAIPGSTLTEYAGGPQSFSFNKQAVVPPTSFPTVTLGVGADTILLGMSGDAYLGNAMFTIAVDGVQQGGVQTALASHALGQTQQFAVDGTFGSGPHTVAVTFLNDAYGGSSQADRNLYVTSLSYNGVESPVDQAALLSNGTATLTANPVVSQDSITFSLTEDAYLGDAQVALSLDGHLLGSPVVTFLNSGGVSEAFTFTGNFGGTAVVHTATVNFLNDAYGGSALLDRNVYVQAITFDSAPNSILPTALLGDGSVNFVLPALVAPH